MFGYLQRPPSQAQLMQKRPPSQASLKHRWEPF
uniref:Uncharacterized protein n=1 Tax=Arundo donax TaxID=35708 RepID=A0A0A9B4F5_ARUDO